MSMAARCSSAEVNHSVRMKRFVRAPQVLRLRPGILGVAVLLLLGCPLALLPLAAQVKNSSAAANAAQARKILNRTVQALGGQAWLNLRAVRSTGRTAGFYHGVPTGAVQQTTETDAFATMTLPFRERIDLAKGKVIHIYVGDRGWEITYKGKKDLPATKLASYLRWRNHSLDVALREWFQEPGTMLIDGGRTMVGDRLVEMVTLFSKNNDSIALEIDLLTGLPRRLSFPWRDPGFHDINRDSVEYDNYRRVDGIAIPFTVTRLHNGETVYQRFLKDIRFDPPLTPNLFNPDRAAAHLK